MARDKLTDIKRDLMQDEGSVLWSFIKGEQLEFPIAFNFIEDTSADYEYEAVVIEGLNSAGVVPTQIQPGGAQTTLNIRIPNYAGDWEATTAYDREDVVKYGGLYYRLLSGTARVDATTPDLDSLWMLTDAARIYIQFPSTLGSDWEVQPEVNVPVYGFFELRVTEPNTVVFQRTWKPVRGMVEIFYSPTDVVPDV